MKFCNWLFVLLLTYSTSAMAEITDVNSGALSLFGSGCENFQENESNATIRLKATDKACYNAVTTLKEIINIKDSFSEHDFNVMIYNIVDEYIEDMSIKTVKQDSSEICIEVTGYITTENIGKAIDNTIKTPEDIVKKNTEEKKQVFEVNVETKDSARELVPEIKETAEDKQLSETIDHTRNNENKTAIASEKNSKEFLQIPQNNLVINDTPNIVVLSTIFVRPTEFYNNTQSDSHSNILKNILSNSEHIKIVNTENEANFVVTPKVLKAKVEPLNSETNRMQMVVAIDTFDVNKNTTTTEHQNKFVLFNTEDDEQTVAKTLLSQLFEIGSLTTINVAEKSSKEFFNKNKQNFLPEVITAAPK